MEESRKLEFMGLLLERSELEMVKEKGKGKQIIKKLSPFIVSLFDSGGSLRSNLDSNFHMYVQCYI